MNKIIIGGTLLLGLVLAARAADFSKAKEVLAQNINLVIEQAYDSGFIAGYQAGFKAANARQTDYDKSHI